MQRQAVSMSEEKKDPEEAGKRWGLRLKSWLGAQEEAAPDVADAPATASDATEPAGSGGFLERMRSGLSRTRQSLGAGLANVLIGGKEIDDELLEDIETQLIAADIGIEASSKVLAALTERVSRQELTHAGALMKALREELCSLLEPSVAPLQIDTRCRPFVILVVGVNGVGKTTTIGKLAKFLQKQGLSVMLAAGDTFRAAAVEQLVSWGQRNDVPVIAQGSGADSAAVIFDALQSARARGIDVLLADTAGRLNNKSHLMEELRKVVRVLQKIDPQAPHETLMVVDASTGQNALQQARDFHQAVPLSGLAVTKLDGTAKGGVIFSLAAQLPVPLRFIGVGEKIDDLRPFKARDFVQALLTEED